MHNEKSESPSNAPVIVSRVLSGRGNGGALSFSKIKALLLESAELPAKFVVKSLLNTSAPRGFIMTNNGLESGDSLPKCVTL